MAYKKDKLSVSIFVKYCLDNKIPPLEIKDWIGLNSVERAYDIKNLFQSSFLKKPENKETYEYFLRKINSNKQQKIKQANQKQLLKQD